MSVEVIAQVKQVSESASEGQARTHRVTIDRPEAKGGSDAGAMGGELFLMGLGGCFMSNLLAAVQSRESEISDLEVEIRATLDGTPPRFTAVTMEVSGTYQDRDEVEKLVVIAERGCIVANSVKEAVTLTVRVA
jgi:putative redox protein